MRFFCISMHSSLIRGLRSIKCSSQIILLYFMYEKTHVVFNFMQFKSCTKSKISWVFSYIKYSKFWSFSLEHFIESKPFIYEEYASALAGKSWLVLWGLAQRFAHYISFAMQFMDLKNTLVCLTFDPLGLQMTTIAQDDWNLLRI